MTFRSLNKAGRAESLSGVSTTIIGQSARVQLWENDPGAFNQPDDGPAEFFAEYTGGDQRTQTLNLNGGTYEITYRVERPTPPRYPSRNSDRRWAFRTVQGQYPYLHFQRLGRRNPQLESAVLLQGGRRSMVADAWPKGSVLGSIRQSTYDRDAYLVENHVKPALGRIRLKNLSSAHVQGFYRDRLDHGLSASTVHKILTVLHKALARAVAWQMVPRNVTDAVEPPRPAPREMHPLSPAEARKLLDAAQGDRLEALYVLAVHTGMRQGELLALKWQDVDIESATVSVRRTLTRSGGRYSLGEPKMKKSRRSIRLAPQATDVLRQHLERQLSEMQMLGDAYADQGLVFTTDTGALVNPSNLRQRSFAPLLKRANLPRIRFHDLRHTCATLLLKR